MFAEWPLVRGIAALLLGAAVLRRCVSAGGAQG